MMYRAVCQPDGAHGGGPLCLSANTHFSPSQSTGCPVCVVGGGEGVHVFERNIFLL